MMTTRHTDVHGAFTTLECLDRYGLVALADLRPFCDLSRPEFDAQLRDLRVRGILTLIGCEGRHGLSERDSEAAVREHGDILTHVVRRR